MPHVKHSHENEEPHLSSAASCIRFTHLGGSHDANRFKPVYTHQSFDGERIRGHQPFDDAIEQTMVEAEHLASDHDHGFPHHSFQHHSSATHRISLNIVLAPSCRSCSLTVISEPKKRPRPTMMTSSSSMSSSFLTSDVSDSDGSGSRPCSPLASHPPASKRRRRSSTSVSMSTTSGVSILEQLDSLGGAPSSSSDDTNNRTLTPPPQAPQPTMIFHPLPSGRTRRRRMDVEEVISRAGRALPPIVRCEHRPNGFGDLGMGMDAAGMDSAPLMEMEAVEDDYLDQPIGTVLQEYRRPIRDDAGNTVDMGDFVLCLADGRSAGVAEYHNQVQGLALWFIENASAVDVSAGDGDGGYWKVLYVFRRHAVEEEQEEEDDDDTSMEEDAASLAANEGARLFQRAVGAVESFCSTARDGLASVLGRPRTRSAVGAAATDSLQQPDCDDDCDHDPDSESDSEPETEPEPEYRYSLVGYMTLFHFFSQYKKPNPGTVMRMCQAVVLPTYQRAGHGKVMMHGVHSVAGGEYADILPMTDGQRGDIVEVDVEDPAIEFTALRNRVDYELVRDVIEKTPNSLLGRNVAGSSIGKADFYRPLSAEDIIAVSGETRITPSQVAIALEIHKRQLLNEDIKRRMKDKKKKLAVKRKNVAKLEAVYESMVKARLSRVYKEDISGCGGGKAEKEAVLSYLYNETLSHYQLVLKSRSSRSATCVAGRS